MRPGQEHGPNEDEHGFEDPAPAPASGSSSDRLPDLAPAPHTDRLPDLAPAPLTDRLPDLAPDTAPALPFPHFIILMLLTMALSGLAYWFRTEKLDLEPLASAAFRAVRMLGVYILACLGLLMWRYGYRLKDFGLKRERLAASTLLGLAVYTVPLAVFVHFVGHPAFDAPFVNGKRDLAAGELVARTLLVFAMAAITDIWTRGFVLLQAARYRGGLFAIVLQNLVWFALHLYEIELLRDSWGLPLAVAVTLFIGIAGDLGVLRYRNVWGLAIGHVYLNAVFVWYVVGVG